MEDDLEELIDDLVKRRYSCRTYVDRPIEADQQARLFASTIYSRMGSQSRAVYVHAKLAVVDDRWLTVGPRT